MSQNSLKEYFSKGFLKDYIYRIRYYVLISTVIFVASFLFGCFFSDYLRSIMMQLVSNMANEVSNEGITFTSIFFNNVQVAMIIVLGGFLFSILSMIMLFVNGALIGFVYTLTHNSIVFLVLVVPHGIFELPALILSCTTSLMITVFVVNLLKGFLLRKRSVRMELANSKLLIMDILVTIFLMLILFFIAAIIEVYFTGELAHLFVLT